MIPICWKCCHQLTEPDETDGCYRLVGCEICSEVVDYATAQIHCPIIDKNEE